MPSTSRSWKIAAFALTVVFLAGCQEKKNPLVIEGGHNFLATTSGSFTTVSLPEGFFGEKNGVPSDPIVDQVVTLVGRPTGSQGLSPQTNILVTAGSCHSGGGHHHCHKNALDEEVDTITRIGSATLENIGDNATVALEIVALSLQTSDDEPLKIAYGEEEPSYFQASLTLGASVSQEEGSITFNRTKEDGGTTRVTMPVNFEVVFTSETSEQVGPVALSATLESSDNDFAVAGGDKEYDRD